MALIAAAKIAVDFSGGEGLFHPTHDALATDVNKTCRAKLIASNGAPPAAIETFCSCFADKVASEAISGVQEPPAAVAQRATAACQ
jgi:hypothetical protein